MVRSPSARADLGPLSFGCADPGREFALDTGLDLTVRWRTRAMSYFGCEARLRGAVSYIATSLSASLRFASRRCMANLASTIRFRALAWASRVCSMISMMVEA